MKNIVFLITDTFRYDNIGDRARRPVRTPDLDRFAATRATEVGWFVTGSFPTIPQRTDLATGRVGWPRYGWQEIDKSGPNHLAKMLSQAGYATQLICDCPHLFKSRFDRGFDAAFQERGQESDLHLLHLNDPIRRVQPVSKTRSQPRYRDGRLSDLHRWVNRYYTLESQTFAARTALTAQHWLEENYLAGPFFLWVDFFDPHEPWDPPEYMVRRYDPNYDGPPMIHPNYGPSSVYTPEELHNLWAHYAAESELVDRALGRVLQKLDDLEMWDNTIVAVLSDHGMSVGEHGRCGKSNIHERDPRFWPLYPEISRSLFMIAGGEVRQGRHLDIIAQPVDVAPTVCELAGVTVQPPEPFEGLSFAELLVHGGAKHREFGLAATHSAGQAGTLPRKLSTPFLVTQRWGYAPVGPRGPAELYDLSADPLAESNVAAKHPRVLEDMQGLFFDDLKAHGAQGDQLSRWQNIKPSKDGAWAIDYPIVKPKRKVQGRK